MLKYDIIYNQIFLNFLSKKNKDSPIEQRKTRYNKFYEWFTKRNPGETEFHQAVEEVAEYIIPL